MASTSQMLCPSYPYPVANASTVLHAMRSYLDDAGNNISTALRDTPGGAVVSVVYRDTVIWTHEHGLIDMSGEACTSFSTTQCFTDL